jgi:hypothetical protein
MPKGPISTPFEKYVADPIPNMGRKGSGANYDEYAGITSGDSDEGGELGTILTSYDIQGTSTGGDVPEAGKMDTEFDAG